MEHSFIALNIPYLTSPPKHFTLLSTELSSSAESWEDFLGGAFQVGLFRLWCFLMACLVWSKIVPWKV